MKNQIVKKPILIFATIFILSLGMGLLALKTNKTVPEQESPVPMAHAPGKIKNVWLVVMENHNWVDIDSSNAPYITNTLLPMGGHAEQYYNPPGVHPSEPNYIWLEAGAADTLPGTHDFRKSKDPGPNNSTSEINHLVTLLQNSGIPWKAYVEAIDGSSCPLDSNEEYSARHVPFIFFQDVTDNNNPESLNCIEHIRPLPELSSDLKGTPPGYSFIVPNLCNDMHDCSVQTGDTWLSNELPRILNSDVYKKGGAIIITWDESESWDDPGGQDEPIGMIVLSPFAKKDYSNSIHYDHSSLLRTLAEIFGVSTDIGAAANATDLSDFFTVPLGPPQKLPTEESPGRTK